MQGTRPELNATATPSPDQGLRHHLWLALLVAASVAFSLGFACATPFAAFAAAAALTLGRRDALLVIGGVWLGNQWIGYGFLGYPWTVSSVAWGLTFGAAAVSATLAARAICRPLDRSSPGVRSLAAFLAACIAYEAVLFIVAAALLGGVEEFLPATLGRIFAINAAALLGLLVLNRLGAATGLAAAPAAAMRRRHA